MKGWLILGAILSFVACVACIIGMGVLGIFDIHPEELLDVVELNYEVEVSVERIGETVAPIVWRGYTPQKTWTSLDLTNEQQTPWNGKLRLRNGETRGHLFLGLTSEDTLKDRGCMTVANAKKIIANNKSKSFIWLPYCR